MHRDLNRFYIGALVSKESSHLWVGRRIWYICALHIMYVWIHYKLQSSSTLSIKYIQRYISIIPYILFKNCLAICNYNSNCNCASDCNCIAPYSNSHGSPATTVLNITVNCFHHSNVNTTSCCLVELAPL